jgi:type I restriction enzyme M protein
MSKLLATLPDGKVCDFIDQKIRNDTPEEYVRQNIERRLVLELGYLPEQIEVEYPIKQGSKTVRVDLAIFREGDQHNQENIWIVIECKKDSVTPSASKDGIEQLRSYMAACDNSEWGMWTNGRKKTVLRRIRTKEGIEYEEPNDIPSKNGNVEEVDRPTRDALKNAVGDNLLFSFKICHDHIYVTDGLQKQPAFFELLKVIFCKIHDERNFPNPLEFYATAKEKKSNDGRLTVFNRISKIFSAVKKQYPAIFDANDEIKLQPRSLAYIIGELQRYSFLSTNIDVKGKAYEELVGANLRGDRGEFFTPRNVQKMTIRMLEPKVTDKILDQSCGTGGFLVIAMNEVIKKLKLQAGVTEQSDPWMQNALNSKIQETAKANFFGIDINPDLVKATKMNMVMNNDGSGNILRQDSLLHPHQWEDSFRKQFAKALDIDPKTLRSEKDLGHFDLIATTN